VIDCTRLIIQAYREILDRSPDPGGLAHFNAELNRGLTEAQFREILLRSPEFAQRFPGEVQPPPPPPPPPPGPGDPEVVRAAFYYAWFPQTWTVNGKHVFYHPTLGYYRSDDPRVVDEHIRMLDYGKVNVGLVSWWGIDHANNDHASIALLFDRVESLGSPLKWAIYYEKEGFGNQSIEEIQADLAYIKERYTNRPGYARREGKPVLFVYNADDFTCEVVSKWVAATAGEWYLSLKVFDGWESCFGAGSITWHQYAPASAVTRTPGSFAISPGYHRADEAEKLPRDINRWRSNIREMVASRTPWQLIFFNEWVEGTAVENGDEWATPTGGLYLDALHNDGQTPSTPPPPPPPPTGALEPLRIEGNRFATSKGPIHLQGYIVCCDADGTPEDEAIVRGWPMVTIATLDEIEAHDLNFTDIRLGPFSHSEPNPVQAYKTVSLNDDGGVFDLDQWEPKFWQKLRTLVAHGRSYKELDLLDVWGLHHSVTPWSPQRNVNGVNADGLAVTDSPPQPVHEKWIRKIIRETAEFPNVMYVDGNESWKTRGTVWSEGVIAIAKDELRRMGFSRPVGSNNEDLPSNSDYWTFHQKTAAGARDKPVMVTEYQTIPPEGVLNEAARARDNGTSFHYWAGGHDSVTRLRVLAGLKTIVGGGAPPPVAAECPVLNRWGSKIHLLHRGGTELDIPDPRIDGNRKSYGRLPADASLVVDTTPRWGSGNGQPCNEEKGFGACGGRNCEDPRGPLFTMLEVPPGVAHHVKGDQPFQYVVASMKPGTYRLRCEPRPDVRDALGKPVRVGSDASTEITWSV